MHAPRSLPHCYAELRAELPPDVVVTVLRIGTHDTALVWGAGDERPHTHLLAAGSRKTAADHFRHQPPTPLELENAIAAVEDEIMQAQTRPPRGARLYTADPAIARMARLAGMAGNELPVEAVERLFGILAAVSLGAPGAGLPPEQDFHATLLILRELMHHLGFASIALRRGR